MSSRAKNRLLRRDQRTKSSHYLARLIIKNWAWGDRKVRYVDLGTDTAPELRRSYPDSFGVSGHAFPEHIEKALDREIETPLGQYIDRCKRTAGALIDTTHEKERRAIVLTLLTQGLRTDAGVGGRIDDLAEFVERGSDHMSTVAKAVSATSAVVGVNVDGPLFLPSVGMFAVPMIGGAGWAMALTPTTFVAVVPSAAQEEVFRHWRGLFTVLSIGVKGDRVIVPPQWEVSRAWLRDARALATDLVSSTLRATAFIERLLRRER